MTRYATDAVSALIVWAEKETTAQNAASVKTVSKWYAFAATDAQIAPSFVPNAAKNANPAPMTSFAVPAEYALTA